MAINVNLLQLNTLNNTSILAQSNANFATIQTALANALSLNNQSPNQMQSSLDMNNNQILNLPPPASANSPARLVDVISNPTLALTIPPIGTSGSNVGLLNGNNTYSGTSIFTNNVSIIGGSGNLLVLGANGAVSGQMNFAGSTSGNSVIGVTSTGLLFITPQNGQVVINAITGNNGSIALGGTTSGSTVLTVSNTGAFQISSNGAVQFSSGTAFSANGAVATTLGSVGPTGSHTTVQSWLTILDNGGNTRYIPCF